MDAQAPLALAAAVCTFGAVTVPSLASVYNEYALKSHMETSVHQQNLFLYLFGVLFNGLGAVGVMTAARLPLRAVFEGHSWVSSQPGHVLVEAYNHSLNLL